jgi:hypothetical protein
MDTQSKLIAELQIKYPNLNDDPDTRSISICSDYLSRTSPMISNSSYVDTD